MSIRAEIKGLRELQRKAEQVVEDLGGAPLLNAMRDSVLMIERDAKILAPVDTGRLRASITPSVVTRDGAIQGVVGSNVEYAPYQEFGTGQYREGESQLPAGIYNMPQLMVSLGIRRGGVRPKRYLRGAVEKNEDEIKRKFEGTITVIVNK